MNYSPLRYPGGKSRLYECVAAIITAQGSDINTYVEPFAGGAGVALSLLLNENVENIIINDINKGVYSFWRAICTETDKFLKLIEKTPVDINQYYVQKQIHKNQKKYSIELGFSTFYLNRTNYSGILASGPIGGIGQNGKFKINARYDKDILINKIKKIAKYKSHIKCYNKDIIKFNTEIIGPLNGAFIYFDPPYYIKGKNLYTNFLNHSDHIRIYNSIKSISSPWLLTYDNSNEISKIYNDLTAYEFNLSYFVNSKNTKKGTELMYFSDPNYANLIPKNIREKINLKEKNKNGNR